MKKALSLITLFLASAPAIAAETAAATSDNAGFIALGTAFAIGIAVLGGGIGQGKIGAAAMDGIARNPQAQSRMFVSMILGLVLIESLVIYALVIAFLMVGKI